ncbi:Uncharacterised protein [Segatella copri]|nr:Uncharacterised protein [Segatella copri]
MVDILEEDTIEVRRYLDTWVRGIYIDGNLCVGCQSRGQYC